MKVKRLRGLLLSPLLLLAGCHLVLLDPSGDVARRQSDIMLVTTGIIALIIVPVLIAIGVIAWRYRSSNKKKVEYDPEWDHSPTLELMVWAAPLVIIIAVGAISWIGTHQLDPYRSLTRIAPGKPVPADVKPLEVDVVSLRWKWLFFYPKYGIATVNQLAAPVDMPIRFNLTSDAMMNSFFVPALVGQVYTMPGMQTVLHAVIDKPGRYKGFSANFSGSGFTDMRFTFEGMSPQDFKAWVAKVRAAGGDLDLKAYDQLRQPQRNAPVHYYARYEPGLYTRILDRCISPDQSCMDPALAGNGHAMQGMHTPSAQASAMPADAAQPAAAQAAQAH